jgi:radical SAM/Cys-rich protein
MKAIWSDAVTGQTLQILNGRNECCDFGETLLRNECGPLMRAQTTTLQINVGKLCNQACHQCHVEAGPKRTEIMPVAVAERLLHILAANGTVTTVDITGGAPELNPNFRHLVSRSCALGRYIVDRCNLTILFEPSQEMLPEFLAEKHVEIIASLPCYTPANVDQQRGRGVFEKSIRALQRLNAVGYGVPDSPLKLNLAYNPLGAFLPPPQDKLESDYKRQLRERFGIEFHRLFTITNMPIKRFADFLYQSGNYADYMSLLVNHFNPATVSNLMCRSLVSVGWNGGLYDCDFNQMLGIGIGAGPRSRPLTLWDIEDFSELAGERIATGNHCFGCTAGAGSSCGGALQ